MKKREDVGLNMEIWRHSRENIVRRLQAIHAFPIDPKDPILTVHSLMEIYGKDFEDLFTIIAEQHAKEHKIMLETIKKLERRNFRSNLLSACAILVCMGTLIFYFIFFLEK